MNIVKDNFSNRWNPIFLEERNILKWERPFEKSMYRLPLDGETKIIDFLGYENINEETHSFLVNATSAKYLADIAKYNRRGGLLWGDAGPTNPFDRKILFSGAINIYPKGIIPGTDVQGLDMVTRGKLWFARDVGEDSLRNSIFSGEILERDKERIIENIVRGYDIQKRNEQQSQSKREHDNYIDGVRDHHERTYGTFGRTPFRIFQ